MVDLPGCMVQPKWPISLNSSMVQLCGDGHLSNFGLFGSPERRLVFDLNDFDETLPGPFQWDVKRLAASLEVAGRNNGHANGERHRIVLAAAEAYRTAMTEFAGIGNLGVWYARLDVDELLPRGRGRAGPPARQGPAGRPGQGQDPRGHVEMAERCRLHANADGRTLAADHL